MNTRKIYILITLILGGLAVQGIFAKPAFATYVTTGSVTSTNLLSGSSASAITNFYYNISSIPGNSSITVQFSTTSTQWFSSAGVLNGSDTLSTTGGANLSLLTLGSSGSAFYYKMTLNSTSDQSGTPAVSDIRLDYTPTSGYGDPFAVDTAGNVNIGTVGAKLSVQSGETIGSGFFTSTAPTNGLLVQGSLGLGTTTPWGLLSLSALSSNTSPLFVISTAGVAPAFQIDKNGLLTMNTPGATSTITGNLYVNGTIRGTNVYSGDLYFANGWSFTEAPFDDGSASSSSVLPQGLILRNQYGTTSAPALTIDERGNLTTSGDICSGGRQCFGQTLDAISNNVNALASSTALSLLSVATTTGQSLVSLGSSLSITNQAILDLNARVESLASSTVGLAISRMSGVDGASFMASTTESVASRLASSTEFASVMSAAVASSTADMLLAGVDEIGSSASSTSTSGNATSTAPTTFIGRVAAAVTNLIATAGNWALDKLTARVAYIDRVEAQTVAISNGLEMTDSATGATYCVRITNGEFAKVVGACDAAATTTEASPQTAPITTTNANVASVSNTAPASNTQTAAVGNTSAVGASATSTEVAPPSSTSTPVVSTPVIAPTPAPALAPITAPAPSVDAPTVPVAPAPADPSSAAPTN